MSEQNIVIDNNVTRPINPCHPIPATDSIHREGQIRFYMNDESAISLIENVDVPSVIACPPLSVQNYVGFTPEFNSPQAMAANCMQTMLSAQTMFRKYIGDPLPHWVAASSLRVYPQAGFQLNAFYNRASFQFFTGQNAKTGQIVHTCLSNGTITHEFTHAILDCLKPMLFSSPIIEQSAAHEGIADCGSILHTLTMDPTLTLTAQQIDTGLISTVASAIAPDLGYAINGVEGALRDASVPFYYQKPENLPKLAPRDQLSQEFHSFSRIWSSAFYAAVMAVYAQVKALGGIGTREALIVARDVMGVALIQGIIAAPITIQYMSSLANSILTALSSTPYVAVVSAVFMKWGLTTVQVSSVERHAIRSSDRRVKIGDQEVLIREKHATIVLADKRVLDQTDNPLYQCKVEVPREEMLMAHSDGMATMVDGYNDDEIFDQVKFGLDYIWESGLVALHGQVVQDHHLFSVDETGLLTRIGYNSDDGYFNNATLPGTPEFGKPWKPENNSGCCGGCKKTEEPHAKPVKLGVLCQRTSLRLSHGAKLPGRASESVLI